jgi:hypothetical protein
LGSAVRLTPGAPTAARTTRISPVRGGAPTSQYDPLRPRGRLGGPQRGGAQRTHAALRCAPLGARDRRARSDAGHRRNRARR